MRRLLADRLTIATAIVIMAVALVFAFCRSHA